MPRYLAGLVRHDQSRDIDPQRLSAFAASFKKTYYKTSEQKLL